METRNDQSCVHYLGLEEPSKIDPLRLFMSKHFTSNTLTYSGLKNLNRIHEQTEGRMLGALEVLPVQTIT